LAYHRYKLGNETNLALFHQNDSWNCVLERFDTFKPVLQTSGVDSSVCFFYFGGSRVT